MSQYKSLAVDKKKTCTYFLDVHKQTYNPPSPKKNTASKIKKYSLYNRYTDLSLDEIKVKNVNITG